MSDLNVSLIMNLVDRVTRPLRGVERAMGGVQSRGMKAFGAVGKVAGAAALGGIAALGAATVAAAQEAIKFEDAWDQANKTLGYSDDVLAQHKENMDRMSFDSRMTRIGLVEMSAEFGRQGIQALADQQEIIDLAGKAATAFEVAPARMAQIFGNLRETLKYSTAQLDMWANKVNYLGNNTAAAEADIAEYASRVQSIAKDAGLGEDATLALGAAMIAAGRAPEVASTGMRAFLRTMTELRGDMSETEQAMLSRLGLDGEWDRIQKQFTAGGDGAVKAVREVSAAIAALPEEERLSTVTKLFGEEAQNAMGSLLSNTQAMGDALMRIDEIQGDMTAGALQEEHAGINDNVAANWQKVLNVISAIRDMDGQQVLAPLNNALKATRDILVDIYDAGGVTGWLDQVSDGRIGRAAESIRAFAEAAAGRDIGGATAALRDLLSVIAEAILPDWLLNPRMPEGLRTFVDGMAGPVSAAGERLSDAWAQMGPTIDNIRSIKASIADLLGLGGAEGEQTVGMLDRLNGILGTTAGIGLEAIATGINGVALGLETLTGIVAKLFTLDWSGIGAEVREWLSWLKSVTIPKLPAFITNRFGGGPDAAGEVQERARGGAFGPGLRLVGEKGPELEYVNRSGFIAHHGQLREMLAMSDAVRRNAGQARAMSDTVRRNAAGARPISRPTSRPSAGAGGRSVTVGDIVINAAPGQSPRQIAAELRREIEAMERHGDDLHDGGFYAA